MFKSVQYVVKENFSNLYRIFCIAKYELLADMRDSKFGLFWNFASPAIQVLTYFLIFGLAWSRKPIKHDGIEINYCHTRECQIRISQPIQRHILQPDCPQNRIDNSVVLQ